MTFNGSPLKNSVVKITNITRVITSCIIFNCNSEKGPPNWLKPNLFAGTCAQYSKNAINQLITITPNIPQLDRSFGVPNFRCPYQANVIKLLDKINSKIVDNPLPILTNKKRRKIIIFCTFEEILNYL